VDDESIRPLSKHTHSSLKKSMENSLSNRLAVQRQRDLEFPNLAVRVLFGAFGFWIAVQVEQILFLGSYERILGKARGH
jgi:hypothetical protein